MTLNHNLHYGGTEIEEKYEHSKRFRVGICVRNNANRCSGEPDAREAEMSDYPLSTVLLDGRTRINLVNVASGVLLALAILGLLIG